MKRYGVVHSLLLAAFAAPAWAQTPAAAPAAPVTSAAPAPASPAPSPAAPNRQPPPECLATLDKLAADIPRDESGPVLRSKGLRIAQPILVPEEVIKDRSTTSAARIRVLLDGNGSVVPGSVVVQAAVGDVNLPLAMSQAVPATLKFDVSQANPPPKEFAFTTVYLVCAQR